MSYSRIDRISKEEKREKKKKDCFSREKKETNNRSIRKNGNHKLSRFGRGGEKRAEIATRSI